MNTNDFNVDYYNFFADVAKNLNCTIKSLSNNYIFEVFSIDKNKKFYIFGNSLPLNNNCAQKICADKVATSLILSKNNINSVEHFLFKNPQIFKNWNDEDFCKYLQEYGAVVVKDNQGFCGNLCFKANNIKEVKKYSNIIFNQLKDVAISPYIEYQDEYRLIMLDNKCEICFKKQKPFVVGDGIHSVKELVGKKYGQDSLEILDNSKTKLKKDEKFIVGWKNNLKNYASVENVEDRNLKKKLESLAKECTKLLDIKFCSIDIIEDKGIFKVLEINSIVSILRYASSSDENYKLARTTFRKAFVQLLESKGDVSK